MHLRGDVIQPGGDPQRVQVPLDRGVVDGESGQAHPPGNRTQDRLAGVVGKAMPHHLTQHLALLGRQRNTLQPPGVVAELRNQFGIRQRVVPLALDTLVNILSHHTLSSSSAPSIYEYDTIEPPCISSINSLRQNTNASTRFGDAIPGCQVHISDSNFGNVPT